MQLYKGAEIQKMVARYTLEIATTLSICAMKVDRRPEMIVLVYPISKLGWSNPVYCEEMRL